VRVFEPAVARAFSALARAVREDDRQAISEALRGLGADPSPHDRTYAARARLRLPGRLLVLFRIRFGLFAVLSRLGAINDWAALERQLAEAGEAPARTGGPPG